MSRDWLNGPDAVPSLAWGVATYMARNSSYSALQGYAYTLDRSSKTKQIFLADCSVGAFFFFFT